ncbi:unnamed protein product [Cyclocybe aegerita]|uniref:DUF6534 domain-containing protein n=1 Tax=Cyclocybe aegerita TaxID=1973307 RepID=A0A8S0XRX6_CYCAE|nr:unnamed protein product [Cyclocybe aegerita]
MSATPLPAGLLDLNLGTKTRKTSYLHTLALKKSIEGRALVGNVLEDSEHLPVRYEYNDPVWIKLSVLVLFLVDTSQTISGIHVVWHYLIHNYGSIPSLIEEPPWTLPWVLIASAGTAFITQLFLGYRLWRLRRHVIIFIFVSILAAVSFGFALAFVILRQTSFWTPNRIWGALWFSMQVVVDATISVSLIYTLVKSRTGFERSDTVVNRLVRTAIQTGSLFSLFSLLSLILYFVRPSATLYQFFYFAVTHLYANTLMDSLLCRQHLREVWDKPQYAISGLEFHLDTSSTQSKDRTHR